MSANYEEYRTVLFRVCVDTLTLSGVTSSLMRLEDRRLARSGSIAVGHLYIYYNLGDPRISHNQCVQTEMWA